MRDDDLQGILFSKSAVIDLARHNIREQMLSKMLGLKRHTKSWINQQVLPSTNQIAIRKELVAVRGGQHRQKDIEHLVSRLKVRD